jgi:4-hydroxy-tetrahydrodipicolinate reductase
MIRVGIHGALGKMGRRLIAFIAETTDMTLTAAIEAKGTPGVGRPMKEFAPEAPAGVILKDKYAGGADVVIDFSQHAASARLAHDMIEFNTPLVIGTTGLSVEEKAVVEDAALHIAILTAPNMSIGVNVFFDAAARLAKVLGADFDIEIIEAHHRFKKDAPSGTALEAARRVAEARGLTKDSFIFGREGETGTRSQDEIAIHSVRAGDIVGDHTILFSCLGERIELKHQAHTRDAFARGALRAARFLISQGPGMYGMKDVLAE